MYARSYDRIVGWLFFAVGIAGLFVHHLATYAVLTGPETIMNLMVGLAGMSAARRRTRTSTVSATLIGVGLLLWGIWGLAWPQSVLGTAEPLEVVVHIVCGLWGMYVAVHDVNEWRRHVA